jgi:hypothetical protein
MLGDEFQHERNVGRSNNRPVLGLEILCQKTSRVIVIRASK